MEEFIKKLRDEGRNNEANQVEAVIFYFNQQTDALKKISEKARYLTSICTSKSSRERILPDVEKESKEILNICQSMQVLRF